MKTVLELFAAILLPILITLFKLTILQTLLLCLCVLMVKYVCDAKDHRRYPPGPISLPLFGQLLSIVIFGMDEYLMHLYQKYGKMVTLKLGTIKSIIINDFEIMKEFGKLPDFQGRPQIGVFHEVMEGYGIVDTEGPLWKHQRRFLLHALRDYGMGKMRMEEKITNELEKVTMEIEKVEGQEIILDDLLEKSTCNVMFGLAFNKCFDYQDKEFSSNIHKMNQLVKTAMKLSSVALFPWLRPFFRKDINALKNLTADLLHMSDKFIMDHRETLDENNPRDLLDLFIIEMDKDAQDDTAEYHETFTEEQLKRLIIDLFGAGTESSSTTIRWAILYMLHNPNVQKKVQQEIDDVIGNSRAPTMQDKTNLPYTVTTLQEVERLASISPRTVPKCNDKPAKFREFNFPERCFFSINLHAIHRDPKLWDDPERFKPERFINKEGKAFRPPHLVPFGSGKRSCAGERLAAMEIFLFFVTLMQKFTFHSPNGHPPKIIVSSSIIRQAKSYEVIAKSR